MSKLTFSPVEAAALSLTGNHWYTATELQELLYPMEPEMVSRAVSFLREQRLLAPWGRAYLGADREIYTSTQLGDLMLTEYRRASVLNYKEAHHAA